MRIRKLLLVVGLVAVMVAAVFAGKQVLQTMGVLDPPTSPAATSSYTLEDIYNRLASGAAGTQSTFTEPSGGPDTGTMHDLNEIMAQAPVKDDANGATATDVLAGKKLWGLTGGQWGTRIGIMPDKEGDSASTDQVRSSGVNYFTAPEGHYDGDDRVSATDAEVRALDADTTAENIKSGVDIFGMTGSYAVTSCTGNATTADVLYPKTFSNSSSTGLIGQRHGGCTCTGTLVGTRWCDNGDGTVTDLTTCLVWLKDADWQPVPTGLVWLKTTDGAQKPWEDCATHDDAHTLSGTVENWNPSTLNDGSVLGDWRLPTLSELKALTSGTEGVSFTSQQAFSNVQSAYWTSTTCLSVPGGTMSISVKSLAPEVYAYYVEMSTGDANKADKSTPHYVWPVRGGQ